MSSEQKDSAAPLFSVAYGDYEMTVRAHSIREALAIAEPIARNVGKEITAIAREG